MTRGSHGPFTRPYGTGPFRILANPALKCEAEFSRSPRDRDSPPTERPNTPLLFLETNGTLPSAYPQQLEVASDIIHRPLSQTHQHCRARVT